MQFFWQAIAPKLIKMQTSALICIRGDPFITFAERGRGGVEKFDQNANAVREVA